MSAAQIRQTFERYTQCVSAGDVVGLVALYSEDACIEIPVGGPVHRGVDAIRTFYADNELAESLSISGKLCIAGDEAAVPLVAHVRRDGLLYELDVIDVASFHEDGRFTCLRAFFDLEGARPL